MPNSANGGDVDSTDTLQKLTTTRGSHRAWCTRKCREADTLLQSTVIADDVCDKLQVIKMSLISKLDVLASLNDKIIEQSPEESIEKDITEASDRESEIRSTIYQIEKLSSAKKAPDLSVPAVPQASVSVATNLPKLQLPKFNGDPREWQSFWDIYHDTIHTNPQLTAIQKFTHMKTLLTGSAASAISGVRQTDESYSAMIQILKSRFDKKDYVKDLYLNRLLNLKKVENPKSVKNLRDHYDLIVANISSLEGIGVEISQYEALLIPIIIKTLPTSLQLEISKALEIKEIRSVNGVLAKIQIFIETKERFLSLTEPDSVTSGSHKYYVKKPKPSSGNQDYDLKQSFQFATTNSSPKCLYCGSTRHQTYKCDAFHSIEMRLQVIRDRNLCANCLKPNHIAKMCSNPYKCRQCGRRHHTSICRSWNPQKVQQPRSSSQQKSSPGVGDQNWRSNPHNYQHFYDGGSNTAPTTDRFPSAATSDSAPGNNGKFDVSTTHISNFAQNPKLPQISLQTAVAFIKNPHNGNFHKARIVFDQGSMHSYLSEELAEFLKLPIVCHDTIEVQTFGNSIPKRVDTNIVKLLICKGNFTFSTTMFTSKFITQPIPNVKLNDEALRDLGSLPLADPYILHETELPVSVLIGCDLYWDFIEPEMFVKTSSGPTAVLSKLGYLLSGPFYSNYNHPSFFTTHYVNFISHLSLHDNYSFPKDPDLDFKLDQFHSLENLGILPENQELSVMDEIEQTIKYLPEKSRYEAKLPWKYGMKPKLQSNRWLAEKRLNSLVKKLNSYKNDPNSSNVEKTIIENYQNIIDQQESESIICKVSENEPCESNVTYLPHHCVLKPNSTSSPVRVVLDGSAKGPNGGPSLNQCLHTGPSLISDLCNMLIQFRLNKVSITADVEKAFLQIMINSEDQDYLRFLWKNAGDLAAPVTVYKFQRLPFGLSSSPFLLMASLQVHLKQFSESYPIADKLKESFYMDDVVTSLENVESAIHFHDEVTELMSLASMTLKKWNSSSSEVRDYFHTKYPEVVCPVEQQILGLNWNAHNDTLNCIVKPVLDLAVSVVPTKRSILRVVASIFDPMGFLSPFVLGAKQIFQNLCKENLLWDQEIPNYLLIQWESWVKTFEMTNNLQFPRHLFDNISFEGDKPLSIEIHAFCDASQQAYCCVLYVRVKDRFGNFHVRFLVGKTRVAPLKKLTLPRLELIAALLCVRLVNTALKFLSNIPVSSVHFYTDSENVLYWIQSPHKQWGVFVMHRLREIRALSKESQWQHVRSKQNPADSATRSNVNFSYDLIELWYNGPNFLRESSHVNNDCVHDLELPDCLVTELKKTKTQVNLVNQSQQVDNVNNQCAPDIFIENIVDMHKFSSYEKLVNVTFHVLKAINLFKGLSINDNDLRAQAEVLLIKSVQKQFFPIECKQVSVSSVKQNACHKTQTPIMKQFDLFSDQFGILRARSRLQKANLTFSQKNPILLPRNCYLTKLIVLDKHVKLFHSGISHTLNEVRSEFWFPRGRREVRNILSGCLICNKLKAEPYKSPNAPTLPDFRLAKSDPFDATCLDMLGPIHVKTLESKTPHKAYVAIFTCCVTRAVKLEIVTSLTAESFILALRRFISRVNQPKLIISDNARSIKRTASELKAILNPETIRKFTITNQIDWRFNIPLAPHMVGMIERLVRSTKNALRTVMTRALLTYEEVHTLISEVEHCLNSRPLTFVSDDLEEGTALTPAHLMFGHSRNCLPPLNMVDVDLLPDKPQFLTRRLKYIEKLENEFWSRFHSEYLNNLSEVHYSIRSRNSTPNVVPKVGQVCLLKEPNKKRYLWKLAKIVNVFKGRDGNIRSAEVKPVYSGRKDDGRVYATLKRPIQLLIPLELDQQDNTLN